MLAALKVAGAHAFDPVRFHFLEALAERAQGQNAQVQQVVEDKLAQGLAEWSRRRAAWLATQGVVAVPMEGSASVLSAQAPAEATLDAAPTPLRALTRYLAHATQAGPDAEPPDTGFAHAQPELKSVRQFRSTWSRLSADRQLTLAMQQAPHNAGPINSHMLVLRSLALMRDISPDYLSRFVSYADTLLCLEAVEKPASARGEAQAGTGRPSKKRVPGAPGTLKRSKPRPSP